MTQNALRPIFCCLVAIYLLTIYSAPFENVSNRSALFLFLSLYDLFAVIVCSLVCISINELQLKFQQTSVYAILLLTASGCILSSLSLFLTLRCLYLGQEFALEDAMKNEPVIITKRIVVVSVLLVASWAVLFISSLYWNSCLITLKENGCIPPRTKTLYYNQPNDYRLFRALHGRPLTYENVK
ncbi:LAQU0S10e01420g1_1 [Lachancea quebecensis]|uniref:LAQU0S10e01420g1_1 n=1 Tax=Lachancea quebecensis TaxID=1654605 RepID=A0A0P1KUG5_9SACH|nr:LAQU0S10e01420g1_1 [Lachancea quebecensis]